MLSSTCMSHHQAPKQLISCIYLQIGKVHCCTNNERQVTLKTPNWLDTATRECQILRIKVHFNCSRYQGPKDPFPFKIFQSLSLSSALTMMCLDAWVEFAWITCGLQWHVGWHWSIQVLFFLSSSLWLSVTAALSCHLCTAFRLLKWGKMCLRL